MCGLRRDCFREGVSKRLSRRAVEGVDVFSELLSSDLPSRAKSLLNRGVVGRDWLFPGDFVGDGLESLDSRKWLKSRTLPGCSDCMRLCAAPLTKDLSGDMSGRLSGGGFVVYALSRAFSASAACAD